MNKIWSKDYEVGDYWERTDLKLLIDEPFQVVLEAVVGDGHAGDIAIDDTSFTSGCILANIGLVAGATPVSNITSPNPCAATNQFMCLENGQCIDEAKVYDFKIDCPTPGSSDEAECGTCTFDNNNGTLCGWKDFSFASIEWNVTREPMHLGPLGDHTTGIGFYIFVLPVDWFEYVSLRSPVLGHAGFECQLKFWYYMNFDKSIDSNTIYVYIRKKSQNFTTFHLLILSQNRLIHGGNKLLFILDVVQIDLLLVYIYI